MDARIRILELFEKHRAVPGSPFDEAHFLDFLLAKPSGRDAVRNSFRGLRRFNAFIEEVQYEFGVCFSLHDCEANYPLNRFVERVLELQKSRRGSLRSLNNQVNAGAGWQVLVIADLILLAVAVWLKSSVLALTTIGALAVLLNSWFFRIAWESKRYLARLKSRIEAAE
jgi:hypothetical protein